MNAVSVGCPPVLVVDIPMMSVRLAGIVPAVRCGVVSPAVEPAASSG